MGVIELTASHAHLVGHQFPWQRAKSLRALTSIQSKLISNLNANEFPADFESADDEQSFRVSYTIDPLLQKRAEQIISSYRPDYAAVVAMDANTGAVLSLLSYTRDRQNAKTHLALRAGFPAASIFKVITATAAIEKAKFGADSEVRFMGGNHTLYKRNVNGKPGGWERKTTLREAFSKSINTVFGKVGLFHVGGPTLQEYAKRFMFNSQIPSDLPIEMSRLDITEDEWSVVEAASGFTRNTTMSVLHGAMIAASIANAGKMPSPYLIASIDAQEDRVYSAAPGTIANPLNPQSAQELKIMMADTVKSGTSRKAFRRLLTTRGLESVEMGGKTGSLTGTNPRGKYDWFVGFSHGFGRNIAISVLTIHEELWRVKSAQVAAEFIGSAMLAQRAKANANKVVDASATKQPSL
jgi:peptidoglycan glycosyltransferase